ncbi:hypothetical protein EYF80_033782 [Liparis tanakae]|uniref:Uncharacterized protein n=1 Tax=Liparis tanakae TaxID=230148 RepID=A0A4Z2GR02_9TELE|nr:hypothetical protein EYF80_033782 [Liparis tanakae]
MPRLFIVAENYPSPEHLGSLSSSSDTTARNTDTANARQIKGHFIQMFQRERERLPAAEQQRDRQD